MTTLSHDTYPVPVGAFLPTDAQVYAYFCVRGAAAGDAPKIEYYYPDGTPLRTGTWSPLAESGNYCLWSSNDIAGTRMASTLGMYTAKVYWNDSMLFTMNFWIQNPGMSMDQKIFDFQVMASLYAKRYVHYDWKKTLFKYDALDLAPWLDRIRNTRDDLDYLEILVQYVAALNDTHATYRIPSDFYADLGFRVDAAFDEGRKNMFILIESINRTLLPTAKYPFQTGDELLSVDGVPVGDLITQFIKYISAASWESGVRRAASYIPYRTQSSLPKAYLLGSTAAVEIKRQSGDVETYTIPWAKAGTPMTRIGPVAMPKAQNQHNAEAEQTPPYMRTLMRFRNEQDENPAEILNYGSLTPVWSRPADFQQRLGRSSLDYFYTGTMTVRGHTVGYLRIPHFSPTSTSGALRQLETEITFFRDNTEGLVVDVMRNTGGDPCYGEDVLKRLIPYEWQALGRQIRPVWQDISDFQYDLDVARVLGGDQATLDLLQARLQDVLSAYEADRALTNPVSTCDAGLDRTPAKIVYDKPILLLTDEFSTSAADGFSAQFQDNKRGKIFGWRTNGAGGGVLNQDLGFYSEGGTARVTVSAHWRKDPVSTPEYPTANYVENIGVRPDMPVDYMQVDNIRQNGKPFVDAFLDAIATEIESQP